VSGRAQRGGFTLLEVMIALAILAFVMAAVLSTQGSALIQGGRVYNLTTATQLASGVILDLEEEYRLDGFPSNSIEGRSCDLPSGFNRFDCEYDLLGLEVGGDNMEAMGGDAMQNIMDSPLMGALNQSLMGDGASGADPTDAALTALGGMGMDPTQLAALMMLTDEAFAELCGVNLPKMAENIPMISSFIPTIIEQAALTTRKLRVRITWDGKGRADKELAVETFLTSTPQAEEEGEGAQP
jgi:prepilin-type N-terminal cleavage/methylation domain-containing protein